MASYTYSLHGLCTTFDFLFNHYGATPDPFVCAIKLSKFLIKNAANLAKKDKLPNLHSWARTCSNQLLDKNLLLQEQWIADSERQDSFKLGAGTNLLFATVYAFDQKWVNRMGRQYDIKGYACFGAKGYYDCSTETASALTENGARLFFWFSKKKDGLSLYFESLAKIGEPALHEKDEIVLPFLAIHECGSYNLEGWKLTKDTGVVNCDFEHTLTLSDKGAQAKAITRTMAKSRSVSYSPKRIVFDRPFAVAVVEKGCNYPAMVAYCDQDSWRALISQ